MEHALAFVLKNSKTSGIPTMPMSIILCQYQYQYQYATYSRKHCSVFEKPEARKMQHNIYKKNHKFTNNTKTCKCFSYK
jgi:hypothetical protein